MIFHGDVFQVVLHLVGLAQNGAGLDILQLQPDERGALPGVYVVALRADMGLVVDEDERSFRNLARFDHVVPFTSLCWIVRLL